MLQGTTRCLGLFANKNLRPSRSIPLRRRLATEMLESRLLLAGDSLVISELLAANDTGLEDADGDTPDWVEIHNPTQASVDLTDWHLTDDDESLRRWTFPNAVIDPDEYLVVFASGKDRTGGELHTNFKLGRGGEYLALVKPDGVTVEFAYEQEFPPQIDDVSYGLSTDLESRGYFVTPTPGEANLVAPSPELPPSSLASQVIINEIMYHPEGDDLRHEFIELWNRGETVVDASEWQISDGVDLQFPEGTHIGAGEYLVIAADIDAFSARFVDVENVIDGWEGRLSNSGERIAILDGDRRLVDEVTYFDEGDWANRIHVRESWAWEENHDGLGASLELIDPNRSNDLGQNWTGNSRLRPSPGIDNRVLDTDTAPLITQVRHDPPSPSPQDSVVVSARIVSLSGDDVSAFVDYRSLVRSDSEFEALPMNDEGLSGDLIAADGVFSAVIAPQKVDSVVEFYVRVEDGSGNERNWPKFSRNFNLNDPKLLYQVVDRDRSRQPDQPFHRLVFLPDDLGAFDSRSSGSDDEVDATLVSTVDGVTEVRYNVGVRLRGNSSRDRFPKSYRVSLPNDRPLSDRTEFNIYGADAHRHLMGQASFQAAGLPNEMTHGVQLRINGENRATDEFPIDTPPALNGYAAFDVMGQDYLDRAFPDDPNGNLYRSGVGSTGSLQLTYQGESADSYRGSFEKKSNETEDDWTDLIELTRAFDSNQTPDEVFSDVVSQVINVQQWLRAIALDVILFGRTDEFFLYRGVEDPRFVLIPHDLGPSFAGGTNDPLIPLNFNPILGRLINDPEFLPFYYAQFKSLSETVFAVENFEPMVDQLLGGWVPESQITAIKNSAANRIAFVQDENPINSPLQGNLLRFLRVTEIMHSPLPSLAGSDADFFEYIELRNTGPSTLDLSGVTLRGDIAYDFSFAETTDLDPGEYLVVPGNWRKLIQRYGRNIKTTGEFFGRLADDGASFRLLTEDSLLIQEVEYSSQRPWPQQAAVGGFSLEIIDTAGNYNHPANWRASSEEGGTPGHPGSATTGEPPEVTRVSVDSSSWSDDLRRFVIDNGGSSSGVTVTMGEVLPWETIDRVSVTFNEDVIVSAEDLIFDSQIEATAFEYDAGSFTATWQFDSSLPVGAHQIELSDSIVDRIGNRLANDFVSQLAVLPGDADGDGLVDLRDFQILRNAIFAKTKPGFPVIELPPTFNKDYSLDLDFNTDGRINDLDVSAIRAHLLESVLDELLDREI